MSERNLIAQPEDQLQYLVEPGNFAMFAAIRRVRHAPAD